MAADEPNRGAGPCQALSAQACWAFRLAVATAGVFVISLVFPIAAGLAKDTSSFPVWWGALDIGVASLLAVLSLALGGLTQSQITRHIEEISYRAYRVLIHGLLVMCVVYMLFGDHIVLPNCLTGLAWRAWLCLYILPAWLAAIRPTRRPPNDGTIQDMA